MVSLTDLDDGLIDLCLVAKSVRVVVIVVPIISIGKVAWMNHEVKLLNGVRQCTDGCVVELRLDNRDLISLLRGPSVYTVRTHVDDDGGVEGRHITCG